MVMHAVKHAMIVISTRLRRRYRALRATRRSRIRRWTYTEVGFVRTVRRAAQYRANWRHV